MFCLSAFGSPGGLCWDAKMNKGERLLPHSTKLRNGMQWWRLTSRRRSVSKTASRRSHLIETLTLGWLDAAVLIRLAVSVQWIAAIASVQEQDVPKASIRWSKQESPPTAQLSRVTALLIQIDVITTSDSDETTPWRCTKIIEVEPKSTVPPSLPNLAGARFEFGQFSKQLPSYPCMPLVPGETLLSSWVALVIFHSEEPPPYFPSVAFLFIYSFDGSVTGPETKDKLRK